jgi:periplasmic divalent cation tolerance protein
MENVYYIMGTISAPVKEGKELARKLVERKLAACVQVTPPVTSVYRWEGKVEEEEEVLRFVKTEEQKIHEISNFLKDHHPYDVPEFIAVPITGGNPAYLNWVRESLS